MNDFDYLSPSTLEGMFGSWPASLIERVGAAKIKQIELLTGDKILARTIDSHEGMVRMVRCAKVKPCAVCRANDQLVIVRMSSRNSLAAHGGDFYIACRACGEATGFHDQPFQAAREWNRINMAKKGKRK